MKTEIEKNKKLFNRKENRNIKEIIKRKQNTKR